MDAFIGDEDTEDAGGEARSLPTDHPAVEGWDYTPRLRLRVPHSEPLF